MAADAAAVSLRGVAKSAVVSDGKDSPDNGDGDEDVGNNLDDGDKNDRAIHSPDTATAATAAANKDDDEGVSRKTLVTAIIRRKTDATDADIPEGGASNGLMMKLRQYLNLTVEALALPRGGCS